MDHKRNAIKDTPLDQNDNKSKLWCTTPSNMDHKSNARAHHFTKIITKVILLLSQYYYSAIFTGRVIQGHSTLPISGNKSKILFVTAFNLMATIQLDTI